jgi:glutamyl/glutaminyl-tRNA synthetase
MNTSSMRAYRGRLAPSPTGFLHLGHARTFWIACQRARAAGGKLVFRNEDLDYQRCKPEFVQAMYEDLRWLGLDWDEGPDLSWGKSRVPNPLRHEARLYAENLTTRKGGNLGGPFGPYSQSQRRSFYLEAWRKLRDGGFIYPCTCSRKDLERALSAPHEEPLHGTDLHKPMRGEVSMGLQSTCGTAALACAQDPPSQPGAAAVHAAIDDELPYPGTCCQKISTAKDYDSPAGVSWRFRVPDGETISFDDGYYGHQQFVAERDFADFLLWRRDDIPAYQLAVVVDDEAMQITEVVRGADLLKSTARQLLLIRALGYSTPAYFHCPLLRDNKNVRLAKRHDALSLRKLREQGVQAGELRRRFAQEIKTISYLYNGIL